MFGVLSHAQTFMWSVADTAGCTAPYGRRARRDDSYALLTAPGMVCQLYQHAVVLVERLRRCARRHRANPSRRTRTGDRSRRTPADILDSCAVAGTDRTSLRARGVRTRWPPRYRAVAPPPPQGDAVVTGSLALLDRIAEETGTLVVGAFARRPPGRQWRFGTRTAVRAYCRATRVNGLVRPHPPPSPPPPADLGPSRLDEAPQSPRGVARGWPRNTRAWRRHGSSLPPVCGARHPPGTRRPRRADRARGRRRLCRRPGASGRDRQNMGRGAAQRRARRDVPDRPGGRQGESRPSHGTRLATGSCRRRARHHRTEPTPPPGPTSLTAPTGFSLLPTAVGLAAEPLAVPAAACF